MADKRNAAVTVEVVHCQHIDSVPDTPGLKWFDIGKVKSLIVCAECWRAMRRTILVSIAADAMREVLYDTFGESAG